MAVRTDLFISDDEFRTRMDMVLRMLKASPPAPGGDRVLVPGEIERSLESTNAALRIPLAPAIADELATFGDSLGVPFPSPVAASPHSESERT